MLDQTGSDTPGAAMLTALDELAMATALLRMSAAPGADPTPDELAYLSKRLASVAGAALERATETPGADGAENALAAVARLCALLRAAASGQASVDCGALGGLAYALDLLTAIARRAPAGAGARAV